MTSEIVLYIIRFIVIYNLVGVFICVRWGDSAQTDNIFDLYNPCCAYDAYKVNWFGAIMISLVYTILCPLGAVCYWFYKLCTVGRK